MIRVNVRYKKHAELTLEFFRYLGVDDQFTFHRLPIDRFFFEETILDQSKQSFIKVCVAF